MTTPPPGAPRWADPGRGVLGPLEVHEAVIETPDGRRLRVAAASREAIIAMGAQVDEDSGHLRPLEQSESPSNREFDEAVNHGVGALQDVLGGHDAFDAMTMLRQFRDAARSRALEGERLHAA
jgi:hypothetical protein